MILCVTFSWLTKEKEAADRLPLAFYWIHAPVELNL